MAGPIPVTAAIEGELSAYAGAGARFDAGGSVRVEAGAETIGVPPAMAWKPRVEFSDPEFHFSADRFAEARAGIGVAVKAGIGNEHITSATLKLGNELAFTGKRGACDWKATFGQFSVEGKFLGWDIETPRTPPLYSKTLWENRCGAPRVAGAALGKVVRADDGARYYIDKTGHRHVIGADAVHSCHGARNTRRLVAAARAAGATIVHAPITFAPGYYEISEHPYGILKGVVDSTAFVKGEWGADFVDAIAPQEGDVVVEGKRGLDTFATTNLDFILRARGITTIALGGFLTNSRTWIPDAPTWDCRMRQGVAVVDTRCAST